MDMSSSKAPQQDCRYRLYEAQDAGDIDAAQRFRAQRFGMATVRDADAFDPDCTHILIRDAYRDELVGCFRMRGFDAAKITNSYAAGWYDLTELRRFPGRCLEIGRFCVDPSSRDPDVLRLAWGAIAATVDRDSVALLFGCSSFAGIDPELYTDAFAYLNTHAVAPAKWLPQRKAPEVFDFSAVLRTSFDKKRAFRQMPPLLRTYLGMGGWVSDHAAIDREMNTLHVFTAVETAAIPPARQRQLRALQAGLGPIGGL